MDDDAPGFEPAALHLEAEIVSRTGSLTVQAARAVLRVAMGMLTGDGEAGPSANDVVVRRRETGGEVLRVTAGSIVQADQMHQRMCADLQAKSVAEFVAEWRLLSPE